MTKREMFVAIKSLIADNAEMVAFIDHEIELLDKKSATPRKPTATQKENEVHKANILVALAEADRPVSIKELVAMCEGLEGLSNQRITHMLTDLRNRGEVKRIFLRRHEEGAPGGKVAHFMLGNETEDTEA